MAGRGFVGLLVARGFAIGRVVELHLTTSVICFQRQNLYSVYLLLMRWTDCKMLTDQYVMYGES